MEKVRDEWTSSGPSCALRLIGLVITCTVLKGKRVYQDENHATPEGRRVRQQRLGRATE